MKLIALLIWYDEPTWCLTELISSVCKAGADHVVAVDGAYMLFPEGRAQSPGEQAQAILATCQGYGVGVTLHTPQEVWFGNEIEKRSYAFALGHEVATAGDDWLWVIDADERITEADGLREALERTPYDVASLMMEEVNGGSREGMLPIRKFFRAQPTGIRLINNHFTYVSGDNQLLYEGFCIPRDYLVEADHFGFVRIDHRGGRTEARNYQAQIYYDRRKEHSAELVSG